MGRHRPEERAGDVARPLTDPDTLFGGWGLKTTSKGVAAYNPIEYHNGTVWPRDNWLMAHSTATATGT